MTKKWERKSYDQQLIEYTNLVKDSIQGINEERATAAVKEIYKAILDIDKIQQEFIEDKHPNPMNWLASQLHVIAPKYNLNENELYGIVLSELHKCNKSIREILNASVIPDDEIDTPIIAPKTDVEREAALRGIDGLLESIALGELGVELKGFLPDNCEGQKIGDTYEGELIQKALNSDFLSSEETDLKWLVAVHAYIELCKNGNLGDFSIAASIQKAIVYVTNLKYLYKRQNGLTEKLKRYLRGARWATVITLLRKGVDLGIALGINYHDEKLTNYIRAIIEPLSINEGLKEFIKFFAPYVIIHISHQILDPLVKKAFNKAYKYACETLSCYYHAKKHQDESSGINKEDEDMENGDKEDEDHEKH